MALWRETQCVGCGRKYGYNARSRRLSLSIDCRDCQEALRIAAQYGETEQGQRWLAFYEPDTVRQLEKRARWREEFTAKVQSTLDSQDAERDVR